MKRLSTFLFTLFGMAVYAQDEAAKLFAESLLGLYSDKSEIQADTVYIYSRYTNASWQIANETDGGTSRSDTIIFHSCFGSKSQKDLNNGKDVNYEVFYVLWKNPAQTNSFWVKKFDSMHNYEKVSVSIPLLLFLKPSEIFDYAEKQQNRFFEQGTIALSDLQLKTKNFTKDISTYILDKRRPENSTRTFVQVLQSIELALLDKQNE